MIITLCGSAKFEKDYIEANKELSLRGFVVIPLSTLPRDHDGNKDWYKPMEKEVLDLVHLSKIQSSDAIVVVGDGYIGHSTSREILWADMNGKTIVSQAKAIGRTRTERNEGSDELESIYETDWDRIATLLRTGTLSTDIVAQAKKVLNG